MMLTIETLFNDANIISAIINRVSQTRDDKIYWQQYLDFRRTTTRVFKDYIGSVTGVMAGSINSRYGEKPIRERRNIGSGYGEIAYLGDAYQISIDRLSELQDLIDKFNAAKPANQNTALNEIINFVYDDFRQVMLAAHKRMDLVVGSLLMTGSANVKNKDNRSDINTPDVLEIDLPFKFITPEAAVADKLISYLQAQINSLKPQYGAFQKMVMSRGTFVKYIVGSPELGDKFKMILGQREVMASAALVTSDLASQVFTGIGLPAIDIKEDYVEDQQGINHQVYADGRITLLRQDKIGYMRFHTPYEATDPIPGRAYTQSDGNMLISQYRDKNGRYLEYTAEWIPQISNPTRIVNFDLSLINAVQEG
ncbi:MAG: hypothetical protein PHW47_00875 [Lachnospira sp.]|uniref:hypothetical protein n=1 Tax=uncultured Bacteroides sp. TaxID=162156 RepID=UPI00280C2E34|nr:hypothetical protein [uncultured Bacteroides sp.]MDD3238644.1 hypothetical protein [Lachnospira sp.]MDD4636128.1 hypothetical protein [Bacteroidales bacterium]